MTATSRNVNLDLNVNAVMVCLENTASTNKLTKCDASQLELKERDSRILTRRVSIRKPSNPVPRNNAGCALEARSLGWSDSSAEKAACMAID